MESIVVIHTIACTSLMHTNHPQAFDKTQISAQQTPFSQKQCCVDGFILKIEMISYRRSCTTGAIYFKSL